MGTGIYTIEIKRERGKPTVIAKGITARGQRYIKHAVAMKAHRFSDPEFKEELATIVNAFLPAAV